MNTVIEEPKAELKLGETHVTLLGTAHVSRQSADTVRALLSSDQYDAVAVELCSSRHGVLSNPDTLAKMNLFQVLREGKASMVMANLALSAYQQKMANELGIDPGAEMKVAIEVAGQKSMPVLLIDREIGTTLKRIYRNIPWWKRLALMSALLASAFSNEKVSEDDIEQLKQGDILESALSGLKENDRSLFKPLIDERDQYMVARLRSELTDSNIKNLLVVIGAGHLKGMQALLEKTPAPSQQDNQKTQDSLNAIPPASRWPKLIPWLIVCAIVAGFAIGFQRSPQMGWQMIIDWVVINGGLSALGATLAWAHPMTILTAFLAAPLTSLNPMIGAGMVAGAMEIFMRKPRVGDFAQLKSDVTKLSGWWTNRVARILLVFFLSSLGSAIGTYIAGFSIFQRLAS
ncbi:MAG TPA: TraB/GumN family protein [Crenotrichaceae bacterium]|nr:TraB/GumN family protein [Crenotrichaceae bacterium]